MPAAVRWGNLWCLRRCRTARGVREGPAGVGYPQVGIRYPEADPVNAAFVTGHGVVRVLEQFVNETALVVVRDLGFLTGILAKPDGACAVDVQCLVADALKKPIAVRSQS
jgi:hypothetical protein